MFNKKPATDEVEPLPEIDFSISDDRLTQAYWHAIKAANSMMADRVANGQASDMEPAMQAWFMANAGKPANPDEFGVMWYLDVQPGSIQLVDKGMLEMTGMDQPENQPGVSLWALA